MGQALSGELSFASAGRLLDQAGADGSLDLSGVTRADSAGLALLLELTRRSPGLKLVNAPPQLRKLAEFFGLDELLAFA